MGMQPRQTPTISLYVRTPLPSSSMAENNRLASSLDRGKLYSFVGLLSRLGKWRGFFGRVLFWACWVRFFFWFMVVVLCLTATHMAVQGTIPREHDGMHAHICPT